MDRDTSALRWSSTDTADSVQGIGQLLRNIHHNHSLRFLTMLHHPTGDILVYFLNYIKERKLSFSSSKFG